MRVDFPKDMLHQLDKAVVLICLLLLQACGLGTEVGNGFKPEDGVSGSSQPDKSVTEQGNPDSELFDSLESINQELGFPVDILFNNCGSPFESEYVSDMQLYKATQAADQKVASIKYDTELNKWLVYGSSGTLAVEAQRLDKGKFKILSSEKEIIERADTCLIEQDYHTRADDELLQYGVVFKDSKHLTWSFDWWVEKGTEPSSANRLTKLRIKKDNGEAVNLLVH